MDLKSLLYVVESDLKSVFTLCLFAVKKTSSQSGEALPTEWLICEEIRRGEKVASVRCCSLVTSITVALFGGCASFPLEEHTVPGAAGE